VMSTWDSHRMVTIARIVVEDHGFSERNLAFMSEWGVFQVVAQTLSLLTAQDFLYASPVVLGVSFAALFAVVLWHALGTRGVSARWRAGGTALVTATLLAIPMVDYHVLYLHTNFGSAIYLFVFCTMFWFAEVEDEPSYVPIALIALTAFALHRTENPAVAILFLALVVAPSRQPRRVVGPWLAGLVVVTGLWLVHLSGHIAGGSALLTPMRCRVVAAGLVAAFAWWLASSRPRIAAINRRLPHALAILVAVALVAMFATNAGHMAKQGKVFAQNLRDVPYWAHAWYGMGALAVIALAFPPPPHRQAFAIGIPVFFAWVLAMAYGGHGYRLGTGDSANRMAIHVVPMIFWYLGLKVLPFAVTGSRSRVAGSA
jgi:hypothetical protein